MAIITRLNASINDHTMTAKVIAFGLLASITATSAAAINHSAQVTKASFDSLVLSAPAEATPTPANKVQATPQTTAPTLSLGKVSTPTLTLGEAPSATLSLGEVSTPTLGLGEAAPLSIQGQITGAVQLQDAQSINNTQINTDTLQSAANNLPLTAANPQNAVNL